MGTPWRAGPVTEPWRRKCFQGAVRLQRGPRRRTEDCPGPCGWRFVKEREGTEGPAQGLGLEPEGDLFYPMGSGRVVYTDGNLAVVTGVM